MWYTYWCNRPSIVAIFTSWLYCLVKCLCFDTPSIHFFIYIFIFWSIYCHLKHWIVFSLFSVSQQYVYSYCNLIIIPIGHFKSLRGYIPGTSLHVVLGYPSYQIWRAVFRKWLAPSYLYRHLPSPWSFSIDTYLVRLYIEYTRCLNLLPYLMANYPRAILNSSYWLQKNFV